MMDTNFAFFSSHENNLLNSLVGVKEHRRHSRKKFNGTVTIVSGSSVVLGSMVDLSQSGISLLINDLFPIGRKIVKIHFDIFHKDESYSLAMPAIPVYSFLVNGVGYKMGFQFGDVEEIHKMALQKILAE